MFEQMCEKLKDLGFFSDNDREFPCSDVEAKKHIESIKASMQNHSDMISKYQEYFTNNGLIKNGVRENRDLNPSDIKAFQNYDNLQENQSSLQSRLNAFEAYLSVKNDHSGPDKTATSAPTFPGRSNART